MKTFNKNIFIKLYEKIIKESLYPSNENNIMFHRTNRKNAPIIQKTGLKTGQQWGKTTGAKDVIEEIYGTRPIFLSYNKDEFKEQNDVVFKVDTTDLILVADIPSLYDKGAYYGEYGMWFEEDQVPLELIDFVDENGMIPFEGLLDPDSFICNAVIKFTQTAACLSDIPANKITVQIPIS